MVVRTRLFAFPFPPAPSPPPPFPFPSLPLPFRIPSPILLPSAFLPPSAPLSTKVRGIIPGLFDRTCSQVTLVHFRHEIHHKKHSVYCVKLIELCIICVSILSKVTGSLKRSCLPCDNRTKRDAENLMHISPAHWNNRIATLLSSAVGILASEPLLWDI